MNRYSTVTKKNQREIVLLKSYPCIWGKCSFCDYISDNSKDTQEIVALNETVLNNVTGLYGVLEVINSGSVFELPIQTMDYIKKIAKDKKIEKLFFEVHYSYRKRLDEIRDFFGIPIIFKCGIESFDTVFRNQV
ncbi:MAG: radical SAM protein, partial [Oscillospiraceae bacterium]